jgi:predicted transcriptional regulator
MEKKMPDRTFTFSVDDELMAAFDQAAKAREKTGPELLRELMQDVVDDQNTDPAYDKWLLQQVQDGLTDADAGNLLSSEEVEDYFAMRRAETLLRIKHKR